MRVVLGPGCDNEWVRGLSTWQRARLADLFRQGRGLRDRTNHGSDWRWKQAGVKTRNSYGTWRRTPRSQGHQRVFIARRDYGFEIVSARRLDAELLDGETGAALELPDNTWTPVARWYVSDLGTANYPPR